MKKIFSTLALVSLCIPSLAFSQTGAMPIQPMLLREDRPAPMRASTTREQLREPRIASSTKQLGFCTQIEKALITINNKGMMGAEKRTEAMNNQADKREDRRTDVDMRRTENQAKRKSQIEELTKRATTEEQKLAVAKFSTALTEALSVKNKAIDTLLATHRAEVDKAVASRKAEVDKALATLTSSIEAAKTQAKNDCANNVDGNVIRTNLKNSIQKAQESFKSSVTSIEKVKDVSEASRNLKKAELKKIEETFRKSVESARNDLKTAFRTPKTTVATSSTTQ
jgi:hypothetical protein